MVYLFFLVLCRRGTEVISKVQRKMKRKTLLVLLLSELLGTDSPQAGYQFHVTKSKKGYVMEEILAKMKLGEGGDNLT